MSSTGHLCPRDVPLGPEACLGLSLAIASGGCWVGSKSLTSLYIPVEGAGFESTTRSLTDPPEPEEHHSRTRGHALIDGLSQRVGVGPGSRTPNPAVAVPTAGRPTGPEGPTPVVTHTHTAPGAGSSLGADGFRAWGEGGGSEAGGSWHRRTYLGSPRLGRALEGVISKKSFLTSLYSTRDGPRDGS